MKSSYGTWSALTVLAMTGLGMGVINCGLGDDGSTGASELQRGPSDDTPPGNASASPPGASTAQPEPSTPAFDAGALNPPGKDSGKKADPIKGRLAYGLDADHNLVKLDTATPEKALASVKITGLGANESLIGIDFRPKDGLLYGVTTASRLYKIDKNTGAATAVGATAFAPALDPAAIDFGFDVNPVADRLRIHVETGQNLRLNPDTGAHVPGGTGPNGADGQLTFLAGDINTGTTPHLTATAYTNSVRSTPTTTALYAIDTALDVLVRFENANAGTMRTIGEIGFDATDIAAFDIWGGQGGGDGAPVINTPLEAYAALELKAAGSVFGQSLYRIDLNTGNATQIGQLCTTLYGLAVEP
jgi:hypothetical protein